MANKKVTRRALFTSIMSLILCCAMLMGTTFAWFTDSVTSGNNIIKSGTLDVTMEYSEDATNWKDASTGTIFNYSHWEPGYTDVKYVKISNVGSLAFKFQLNIIGTAESASGANLADVIDVYMIPEAQKIGARDQIADEYKVGTLAQLMADNDGAAYGVMLPTVDKGATSVKLKEEDEAIATTGSAEYTLALKMQENAGNEYQNLSVGGNGFTVQLLASQYTWENDSFDNNYDGNSAAPVVATGTAPVVANEPTVISVDDKNTGATIATVNLPADVALEEGTKDITVTVVETSVNPKVSVSSNQGATTYDITVSGLSEENAKEIDVKLFVGTGLSGVKVFHEETEIKNIGYDSETGYVTFKTTSFSPYTVVYNAKSDLPTAIVTEIAADKLTMQIPLYTYSTFSKTEKVQEGLDVGYTFQTTETAEEAAQSKYAYWHADFVVTFNNPIAAGTGGLAGQYDFWNIDWVGFEAFDSNLQDEFDGMPAGTPCRLLEGKGVYVNYAELCRDIKTFNCGVFNNDPANAGTVITVELRLYETKPVSETENNTVNEETGNYITVGTYTYILK